MNDGKMPLRGVYPPIPTPFDDDGEVAYDRLKENLQKWSETPLAGFVVLGSNGEFVYLTESEKLNVVSAALEVVPQGKKVIAGTGAESTRETVAMTRKVADLGCHAAIVVTPHYYKPRMDSAALINHYLTVAESSPIPIVLYSMPTFTGVDPDASTIIKLAEHPNIIGVKESGNVVKLAEVIRSVSPSFNVLAGSGSFFYPSLALGAAGGVLAMANVAPREAVGIYEAFLRGDHQKARELQLRMLPVNAAVTSRLGIPALKAALDMLGYYGGEPRSPLLPLQDEQKENLRGILRQAELL
ncbi:MAG: dihydrodipicolinate synthase family protein [Chloroflexi bacterium]|nr:dihydrodipicolinate synthase family protein [Chloroflexota bacterium]